MSRSTKQALDQRIEATLRIMLDGAETWDVIRFGSENGWNVGERMILKYMRRARKLLAASQERDRRKLLMVHVARRNMLYARAVAAGDFRTALSVLHDLALLQGLYPNPADDCRREIKKLRKRLEEAEAGRSQAGQQPQHDPAV